MHCQFFIMGIVNVDILSGDASCENLKIILSSYACSKVIIQPTCFTNYSATLLNISITNIPSNTCTSGILSFDFSDHLPILIFFQLDNVRRDCNEKSCYRKMNSGQHNKFCHALETTNWNFLYAKKYPDKACHIFMKHLGLSMAKISHLLHSVGRKNFASLELVDICTKQWNIKT